MTTTVASCTIRDADVDEAEFLDLVASQAALPVPDDRAAAVLRVAVRHGQVAGFASVTVDGDGGPRLDYVFVHHHVRRQGVGRALLDDARRARPTQAIRVEAHPAAETFFRRIGAQREGNIAPDDRNPPLPAVVLAALMVDTTPTHGHLWTLDDGTPVHAPPGRLTRNDEGQVCCHLCGHWFDHLGAHLRRHGWSAADYRAAVGLAAGRALCNELLSERIARRQAASWLADAERQADFRRGRVAGTRAITARDRDRTPAPEVAAAAAENLSRARARRQGERLEALRRRASAAGVDDVDGYLSQRYEAGDSLADLQKLTGWSRPRVRERLEAAGVAIRQSGATTTGGRQNRAAILESRVAARLGTDDVNAWLDEARRRGLSTEEIARRAGRSSTWVRTRLA